MELEVLGLEQKCESCRRSEHVVLLSAEPGRRARQGAGLETPGAADDNLNLVMRVPSHERLPCNGGAFRATGSNTGNLLNQNRQLPWAEWAK